MSDGNYKYTVRPGDSLYTIAHDYGFLWETVWRHEANAALRQRRENPEVLQPGDTVVIPEQPAKEIIAATEVKHRFRRRGTPAWLRLCIQSGGKVRAHLPFELWIVPWTHEGETDAEGMIEVRVPPDADRAVLVTHGEEGERVRTLRLGHLDPADSPSGALSRLINLGMAETRDRDADATRLNELLTAFQTLEDLPCTGTLDDLTAAHLIELHGC